jgi:hypothetical protein
MHDYESRFLFSQIKQRQKQQIAEGALHAKIWLLLNWEQGDRHPEADSALTWLSYRDTICLAPILLTILATRPTGDPVARETIALRLCSWSLVADRVQHEIYLGTPATCRRTPALRQLYQSTSLPATPSVAEPQ